MFELNIANCNYINISKISANETNCTINYPETQINSLHLMSRCAETQCVVMRVQLPNVPILHNHCRMYLILM